MLNTTNTSLLSLIKPSIMVSLFTASLGACSAMQTTTNASAEHTPSANITTTTSSQNYNSKPRIINTTDLGADPDDEQSMVRQLVMANEFDIEGLIVSTGCWKKSQSDTRMLDKIVDAYGQALPNLQKHAEGFPSHAYLKSVSVMGQTGYGMDDVGAGKDSPGSELIIKAVDKDDPRPVWATCWGGCNTIAQAVWKVQNTRTEAELNKFLSKLRIYDVLGQDNAGTWLAKTFPNLFYIRATKVYDWQHDKNNPWWQTHVQSHGPLGAVFPSAIYSPEGDTPAFLYLVPNGLNDPEMVGHGSWGGRFDTQKQTGIRGMRCMEGEDAKYDPYLMYGNYSNSGVRKWADGYNNDFEARMDWSINSDYANANHHPIAVVNNSTSKQVLYINTHAGASVILNASGSSDPDDDNLNYHWEFYSDASSYKDSVKFSNNTSMKTSVQIPSDANGENIHVILTLKDSGTPNLYAYRRIIFNVQ